MKKADLRYNHIYDIKNINDMKDKYKDLKIIDLRNNKIIDIIKYIKRSNYITIK